MAHSPVTINNSGQISSTMRSDANGYEAFLWEPGRGRTKLGTLRDRGSVATAMNNRGQIVGCSYDAAGHVWGFLWDEATGMTQLDTPDGPRCRAVSINDIGQILVESIRQPLSPSRWFLLDPNGPISLDALPSDAWPYNINGGSCIAAIENPGDPRPYILVSNRLGEWKRLFDFGGLLPATRINDRNQIAYAEFTRSHWHNLEDRFVRPRFPLENTASYLWDPVRGRISLDRYLHGLHRFIVRDLNNEGCIVGTAETRDGRTRSVLLEPISERWGK